MKIKTITNRGGKKDFYDLYFLLRYFSLDHMLKRFHEKYPDYGLFGVIRSLQYFADAEKYANPVVLGEKISWEEVKSTITEKVRKIA